MTTSPLVHGSLVFLAGTLSAQTPSHALMDQANELTTRLREWHFEGQESTRPFDYEALLALADQLDRDPRPGTSAKAAECLVWCLGLAPGEPGFIRAYVKLSALYRQGRGVPQDVEFAKEIEAALREYFDAERPWRSPVADARLMAELLETGRIYPKDQIAAASWRFQAKDRTRALKLCRAVADSDPRRRLELVRVLLQAKEVPEARAVLAGLQPSHSVSPVELAFLLADSGQGREAVRMLTEAADRGDVAANRQLAWAFRDGKGFGIQVINGPLYLRHLRKAADQGDLYAQLELGEVYWHGRWTPADPRQAVDCFRKAGTYGIPYLAEAFFLGRGVDQDLAGALSLFKDAHQEHDIPRPGWPAIADRLTQIYREGLGVSKDPVLSARFTSHAWRAEAMPFVLDELMTHVAPLESWLELGSVLKAKGRFGAAAKVFEKAISLGSILAEAELGDLHAHDRREPGDFRDDFQADAGLGRKLLDSARSRGVKTLWQPCGFPFKKMDWDVTSPDPEPEVEPAANTEWIAKAKKYAADPVRALYYSLCALRDSPGC